MTMAPKFDSDLPPPEHQRVEPPTRLCLMDQQVCKCLDIFIRMSHFDILSAIFFLQALNEVDVWEEECSDEDPCSTASSDCHVIQRY